MDRILLRAAEKLTYVDPASYLMRLRRLEIEIAASDTPPKVKALRTNDLKAAREQRQAALFCLGMGQRLGQKVSFAAREDQDYDFIASWIVGEERHIATVQLKEVVPAQANPQASIHAIVASLTKYTNSDGLTVAIHLNREGRFDPCLLQVPKLKIGSLWVFGSANPDQSRWNLWGDFKESDAYATQFSYPEAHPVERSGD